MEDRYGLFGSTELSGKGVKTKRNRSGTGYDASFNGAAGESAG